MRRLIPEEWMTWLAAVRIPGDVVLRWHPGGHPSLVGRLVGLDYDADGSALEVTVATDDDEVHLVIDRPEEVWVDDTGGRLRELVIESAAGSAWLTPC